MKWAPDTTTEDMLKHLLSYTDPTSTQFKALSGLKCKCGDLDPEFVTDDPYLHWRTEKYLCQPAGHGAGALNLTARRFSVCCDCSTVYVVPLDGTLHHCQVAEDTDMDDER